MLRALRALLRHVFLSLRAVVPHMSLTLRALMLQVPDTLHALLLTSMICNPYKWNVITVFFS